MNQKQFDAVVDLLKDLGPYTDEQEQLEDAKSIATDIDTILKKNANEVGNLLNGQIIMRDKERELYKEQIDDIEEVVTMMITNNADHHSIVGSLDVKTQAELATQLVLNNENHPLPVSLDEYLKKSDVEDTHMKELKVKNGNIYIDDKKMENISSIYISNGDEISIDVTFLSKSDSNE